MTGGGFGGAAIALVPPRTDLAHPGRHRRRVRRARLGTADDVHGDRLEWGRRGTDTSRSILTLNARSVHDRQVRAPARGDPPRACSRDCRATRGGDCRIRRSREPCPGLGFSTTLTGFCSSGARAPRAWGVVSHELGLGGHLARATASLTGRGVDVEISGDPALSLPVIQQRLTQAAISPRYDAIVLTIGLRGDGVDAGDGVDETADVSARSRLRWP